MRFSHKFPAATKFAQRNLFVEQEIGTEVEGKFSVAARRRPDRVNGPSAMRRLRCTNS
jgi:hypothetical protein